MPTTPLQKHHFKKVYAFWHAAKLQLYPETEEQQRFDDMIDLNPDLCFCLVDENEEIVGTILGGFDGRTAPINRLAVSPHLQGRVLGKMLVSELEKKLQKRGIKKVALLIHVNNTQVIPFYEKLGFKEMDYVKIYYKDRVNGKFALVF